MAAYLVLNVMNFTGYVTTNIVLLLNNLYLYESYYTVRISSLKYISSLKITSSNRVLTILNCSLKYLFNTFLQSITTLTRRRTTTATTFKLIDCDARSENNHEAIVISNKGQTFQWPEFFCAHPMINQFKLVVLLVC